MSEEMYGDKPLRCSTAEKKNEKQRKFLVIQAESQLFN